jgi:hypothetical protein
MHGLRAEQTQWRVLDADERTGKVRITQCAGREESGDTSRRILKSAVENPTKLLGYNPIGVEAN